MMAGWSPRAIAHARRFHLINAFAGRLTNLVNPEVTSRPNYRLAPDR